MDDNTPSSAVYCCTPTVDNCPMLHQLGSVIIASFSGHKLDETIINECNTNTPHTPAKENQDLKNTPHIPHTPAKENQDLKNTPHTPHTAKENQDLKNTPHTPHTAKENPNRISRSNSIARQRCMESKVKDKWEEL